MKNNIRGTGARLGISKKTLPIDDESRLLVEGVELLADCPADFATILTPGAIRFVARLSRQFSTRRLALLQRRVTVQAKLNAGDMPSMLSRTEAMRKGSWTISPIPADLEDRRVEITGPAGDAKMVINALNSGASVFMADFEDAQAPTWENTIAGQLNLYNAIRGTIAYAGPAEKSYRLDPHVAVLMVRPRGWHLVEKHFMVDGRPMSASLFDFGLFFFHNAKALLEKGTGPYFYLPKIENHLEAALWNDVFLFAQKDLGIPSGTIKATVLIESILAAFEMDEILYELREHSAGLNCGRWDYIFSFIKKFHQNKYFLLPERGQITMDKGFLSAYVRLLIQTCHRRGAHAIGGMAAQIPIRNDEEASCAASAKVRTDKEREVREGHDGTWVAHPGLVRVAKEIFDRHMPGKNQLHVMRDADVITAQDLLNVPQGQISEAGLRKNVDVAIQYLEAWLRGTGAVPLYHLMEDTATAEISRAQLWQWIHHNAEMADGKPVTLDLVKTIMAEELRAIRRTVGDERYGAGKYELAGSIVDNLISQKEFREFLTIPAYDYLS